MEYLSAHPAGLCQVKNGIDNMLPVAFFIGGCNLEWLGSLRRIGVPTTPGAKAFTPPS
jgi:hypothetical protein